MVTEVWTQILECLNNNLSGPGLQTFLSSAKPISFQDQVLTIQVPNEFSRSWIKEKCEPLLKKHFLGSPMQDMMVQYTIVEQPNIPDSVDQLRLFATPSPTIKPKDEIQFNEKYTFDNFIVGHNNRFAHAASEAVSKAPARAYNPLFIYGSVGLGKTHLLHAIALGIKKKTPKAKISLVSSEKFTNDLINAIKDKKVEAFRAKYRTVDVLLVDDIQFLAGKEQTQEEFFHTFNDLHSNNKQIVLTSDRPPKEIPTLELRLRTRFEWGLIADIQPPELETRIAILRKKIELNHFNIADDILHYIATQIPSNVREMEGALTRIVAYASLLNTEITLSIASNVIRDIVGVKQEKPLSINHIKRKVCDYFNITNAELCAKDRSKDIAFARQVAMYLARELTHVSLPKIGENFGNRDHSTVMHACDKIKGAIQNDPEVKNTIAILIASIRSEE
jgi:chromosomal replication initiator protein